MKRKPLLDQRPGLKSNNLTMDLRAVTEEFPDGTVCSEGIEAPWQSVQLGTPQVSRGASGAPKAALHVSHIDP